MCAYYQRNKQYDTFKIITVFNMQRDLIKIMAADRVREIHRKIYFFEYFPDSHLICKIIRAIVWFFA